MLDSSSDLGSDDEDEEESEEESDEEEKPKVCASFVLSTYLVTW